MNIRRWVNWGSIDIGFCFENNVGRVVSKMFVVYDGVLVDLWWVCINVWVGIGNWVLWRCV